MRVVNSLIDHIVHLEHFMESIIVKAPQKPTKYSYQSHRYNIKSMVPHLNPTHIKHDEPSMPEESTLPLFAVLDRGPQHHHHHRRAEEGPPQEGAPPPRGHLFEGK